MRMASKKKWKCLSLKAVLVFTTETFYLRIYPKAVIVFVNQTFYLRIYLKVVLVFVTQTQKHLTLECIWSLHRGMVWRPRLALPAPKGCSVRNLPSVVFNEIFGVIVDMFLQWQHYHKAYASSCSSPLTNGSYLISIPGTQTAVAPSLVVVGDDDNTKTETKQSDDFID